MVQIKGDGHSARIAAFLTESWAREMFANVTLYCQEPSSCGQVGKWRAINANCSVLAAGSPVFHHYLRQVTTQNEDNIMLLLPDFSYKVVMETVRYLYTGTLPSRISLEFQQTLNHFGISIALPVSTADERADPSTEKHIRVRVLPSAARASHKGKQGRLNEKGLKLQFKVKSRIIRELTQVQAPVQIRRPPDQSIDAPHMSEGNVTLSVLPRSESTTCSPEKGLHGDQYCPGLLQSNRVTGKSSYLGSLIDIGIYNSCKIISNAASTSQISTQHHKKISLDLPETRNESTMPFKCYSKGSLGTKRVVRLPCPSDTSMQVMSFLRHGNKIHVTVNGPVAACSDSSTSSESVSKGDENSKSRGNPCEVVEAITLDAYSEEKKRREKLKNKLRSVKSAVEQAKLLARKLLAKNGGGLDLVARKVASLTDAIRKIPAPKLPCRICKKLVSKSYMWSHLQIHNETAYLCEQCGRTFTLKTGLQMHQRYQHGEESKPALACSTCGKKFSKAHNLKMHMSLHEGLKPHTCHVCAKKFRLAHSLKKHSRIHTGDRPYECQVCGKAFRTRSSYKNHLGRHSLGSEEPPGETGTRHHEIPQEGSPEEAAASILLILPAATCN